MTIAVTISAQSHEVFQLIVPGFNLLSGSSPGMILLMMNIQVGLPSAMSALFSIPVQDLDALSEPVRMTQHI